MVGQIRLRQLNSNGEEAGCEHDPHNFQRNALRLRSPGARVEYVRAMRAHENAESGAEDDFVHVKLKT